MSMFDGGHFSGLFDFDGDGKTDLSEQFLAYKIFEECTKDEEADEDLFSDEEDLFSDEDDLFTEEDDASSDEDDFFSDEDI